jgi:hypothetical protein
MLQIQQLTKDKHMDKEIKKGKERMWKGMCWKGVVVSKIKDLSENKIC